MQINGTGRIGVGLPSRNRRKGLKSEALALFHSIAASCAWVDLLAPGLLVIVPLVLSLSFADQFSYIKIFLSELILALGMTTWAVSFLWGKVRVPTRSRLAAPLALFTLVVLASCFRSPVPADSFREAEYFLCGPLWALLLISCGGGEARMRLASVLVTLAATVVAAIAVCQWSGFDPLLSEGVLIEWGTMVTRMRLYSTLGNPNFVAGYLIGAIFPALALGASSLKLWAKTLGYISAVVMLVAVLGAGSRGAWAGLVAGLTIAGFALMRRESRSVLAPAMASTRVRVAQASGFLVAVGTLSIAVAFFTQAANPLLERISGRWFLWRCSWRMFREHPLLGSGWGTFQFRFLDLQADFLALHPNLVHYWSNIRQLHNDPLQLLLETGVVGVAAFTWILWTFGREVRRALFVESARVWVGTSAGGVTAILVDSVFNFQFYVPPTLLLLFTLLAFPALLEGAAATVSEEHPSPSATAKAPEASTELQAPEPPGARLKLRKLRLLASFAVVVGAVALAAQITRRAAAERDYALALRLEGEDQLDAAEHAYRRGVALDRLNGTLHFGLARVHYRRGESTDALAEVELAERNCRDSHLVVLKGRIEEQMGLLAQALETYRQALRLDPTLQPLHADIARLQELGGRRAN
jgi:putative inorganic carbon (HCO3(-)) transporter